MLTVRSIGSQFSNLVLAEFVVRAATSIVDMGVSIITAALLMGAEGACFSATKFRRRSGQAGDSKVGLVFTARVAAKVGSLRALWLLRTSTDAYRYCRAIIAGSNQ